MKSVIKVLVGTLFVTAALTACGKKGKGVGNAAAPGPAAVGAAGVCPLNAQGLCAAGVGSGYVAPNTWKGKMVAVNQPKYVQFLADNGLLCYGIECGRVSNSFELSVEVLTGDLPEPVNFLIKPRFQGQGHRSGGPSLHTQAEAYMNAANNGFQLVFNRFNNYGHGGGFQHGGFNRPGVLPYGHNGQPIHANSAVAAQNTALQIVLTYTDPTHTMANVAVVYQGVHIASGPATAGFLYGNQVMSSARQAAPATAPYQPQRY